MTHVIEEQRRERIAVAAYLRAERRGFKDGDPIADWLEAEAEVDGELAGSDALTRLEQRIAFANRELGALKARVSEIKNEARVKLAQDLTKLTKLCDGFEGKVELLRRQGEHAGEKAKHQAEKAWQQVSHALERIAAHEREPGE
jgi:hypothetical protein